MTGLRLASWLCFPLCVVGCGHDEAFADALDAGLADSLVQHPTADAGTSQDSGSDAAPCQVTASDEALFTAAAARAPKATEAFERANRFVHGWAPHRDARTGLYPQNLTKPDGPLWTPRNSAADLWPFMVLTTRLTERSLFDGDMRDTLRSEISLTSRVGVLPDWFDLTTGKFATATPDLTEVVFGSAEYVKDGLTPILELLAEPAYFDRMQAIASALCAGAAFPTANGFIPSDSMEVNGDVMLTMTRMYTATGKREYLDCSQRIAEYYLFEKPAIDSTRFVIKDHGGEITEGLVEAYIGLKIAGLDVAAHRIALKRLLDRVLECARDAYGMLHAEVDLVACKSLGTNLADTWGYTYSGIYAYHLVEGEPHYRDEVRRTLGNLDQYENHEWQNPPADGYADAIESAIYLVNWEPVPVALGWIDSQMQVMFGYQADDGLIESWHGDGNFARTALLYALMNTEGVHAEPWRKDLRLGALRSGESLFVSLSADEPWSGALCFDSPRHLTHVGLPFDYPRLNGFPEWFTAKPGGTYQLTDDACTAPEQVSGDALVACRPVSLTAERPSLRLRVVEQ